eukprot:s1_g1721.t1
MTQSYIQGICSLEAGAVRNQRLQRDSDFTGDRLSNFREVFLRHGLPGLILALICIAVPGLQLAFGESLHRGLNNFDLYVISFVLLLLALNAHAWFIDRRWTFAKLGWILYLGALSFWEEWVFRLALPQVLEGLLLGRGGSEFACFWRRALFYIALAVAVVRVGICRWPRLEPTDGRAGRSVADHSLPLDRHLSQHASSARAVRAGKRKRRP